jgi:catechol 2,3-dioxygenase-like lactoylglutathione lyase family enzyme
VNITLNRVLLYVQDVDRLAAFYRDAFGLPVVEEIPGEWAVLAAGATELALHLAGPAHRRPGATSSLLLTDRARDRASPTRTSVSCCSGGSAMRSSPGKFAAIPNPPHSRPQ